MRIGIYSPYLDILGGGERYTLTLAEHLSKNHQVEIFWDDSGLRSEAEKRLGLSLNKTKFVNNIFTRKKSLLERIIKTSQYDLIFFLSDGSIPTSLAKKNILHFQCPFPGVKRKSLLNGIKLSRFQIIVCNSKFTKSYIDQEYNVDSYVVYPPVDVKQFKVGEKKNLIISVGRFSKYYINKKQKEMVILFRKIHKVLPEWELYLIGGLLEQDFEYFNEVKQLAKGLPVRIFPNEPFINLKDYYSQAKIYWHAAGFGEDEETNPAGMEHFGISTVEAMAAGCVPVVYSGGGQREIVTHGTDGFLWRSEEELIDYTLTIARNNDLRTKMAEKAIKKSKDFSKEVFLRRIDEVLFS
jgi:glycosyltransferase involved in cell wall biosynthesis